MPTHGPWLTQAPDRGAIAENLAMQRLKGVSLAGMTFLQSSLGLASGPFAFGYARRSPYGALPFEIGALLPGRIRAPSARPSQALVDLGLHHPPGGPAFARGTRSNAREILARLAELAATGTVLRHHAHREVETILLRDAGDGTAYVASVATCRQIVPTERRVGDETEREWPIFAHILAETRIKVPSGGLAALRYRDAATMLGIRPAFEGDCQDLAPTFGGAPGKARLERALRALPHLLPSAIHAISHANQVVLASTAAIHPMSIPAGNPSAPSAGSCRMSVNGADQEIRDEIARLTATENHEGIMAAVAAWLRHAGHTWDRPDAAAGPGCRLDCLAPTADVASASILLGSGSAVVRAANQRAVLGPAAMAASAADAAEIAALTR